MGKAVFCLASSEFQAEAVVNELKVAGFSDREISVLLPDKIAAPARERSAKKSEGQEAPESALGTAAVGGALGWLAGIEAVSVPGAGAFIAAGPIVSALKGATVGATTGGIATTLQGMGLPSAQAQTLEQKIRAGLILISLFSESATEASRAAAIFEQAGGLDIATTAELEISPPDVRDEKWEQW